ncbi:MAG: hypothetical protein MK171_07005 [Pirellulales bacterium]|nr:hypothetical protein [Pirellulales bacterium]
MLDHCPAKQRLVLATAILLLGMSPMDAADGATGCQQPIPSPCAADGICRPNLEWGYSHTRWRPWPGDTALDAPSEDNATAPEDEEVLLEPYELPKIEEEDLRGPAKKKNPVADAKRAEDASHPLPDESELPEQDEIDFRAIDVEGAQIDRQDNSWMRPARDADGPPALPASLREVASLQYQPSRSPFFEQKPDPKFVPAHVDQPTSIRWINPAAATLSTESPAT